MSTPIGIDDFKELIESNSTFIDKTLLIDELFSNNTKVTLFTRPRRFGKTLNLSMIKYFVDIKEDNTYLYSNLKIAKTKTYSKLNTYPVINLSFKDAKGDINNIVSFIYSKIRSVFENIDNLKIDNKINKYLEELNNEENFNLNKVKDSIYFLSKILYKIHNKKVILLIDEYDAPIINSITSNCYDELRNFFSSLYSTSLKGNEYLEKGILTGIQRVAKENIFSGLNNLDVNTVLSDDLDEYFGFTSEETKYYLNLFNLELDDEVKNIYNGYKFGNTKIYNPWSIINYAEKKKLIAYWANTASNTLLKEFLLKSNNQFKKEFEKLITVQEVKVTIDTSLSVFETKMQSKYLWGLFLNSGYITIKEEIDAFNGLYIISIPNKEVKKEINDLFISYLNLNEDDVLDLFDALFNKKYENFINIYKDFILNNTSFHDHTKKYENSYHMFTLGMLLMKLNDVDYNIISNKEVGLGRVDIMCISKREKPHFIFEFKIGNNPDLAIKQIKDNKYYSNLKGEILLIGISYENKDCFIKIEEMKN